MLIKYGKTGGVGRGMTHHIKASAIGRFASPCMCMAVLILAAALATLSLTSSASARDITAASAPCLTLGTPCPIIGGAGGQYYVSPPPGWDGKRRLGALLIFHGYQSSGLAFIKTAKTREAAHRGGYMLVAADGIGKSWSHTGSPSQYRNEVAYVEGLLADLERRFPIDRDNLWAAGFSQGGSMTWEIACYLGRRFKAFVPIAGAFWNPLPNSCPSGPVNVLHIHGTADRTVPMMGRPIGPYRQGEVMKGWEVMKASNACRAKPDATRSTGIFRCEKWSSCGSAYQLELCLHDKGHIIPDGWADLAYDFLKTLPRTGKPAKTAKGASPGKVAR